MIWNSTNYFNPDFITESGISEKKYEDQNTYQPYVMILGVKHTLGASDKEEDAQAFLDKLIEKKKEEAHETR